jgi:hypothetical protein
VAVADLAAAVVAVVAVVVAEVVVVVVAVAAAVVAVAIGTRHPWAPRFKAWSQPQDVLKF